jgi:hypothetical protein
MVEKEPALGHQARISLKPIGRPPRFELLDHIGAIAQLCLYPQPGPDEGLDPEVIGESASLGEIKVVSGMQASDVE